MKISLFAIFIGILGSGCGMPHHGAGVEERFNWMAHQISHHLDLDEKQQTTLDRIKGELIKEAKVLQGERLHRLKVMAEEFPKHNLSQDRLKRSIEKTMDAENRFEMLFVTKISEFHAVLNPDQRKKLSNKLNAIHGKMSRKMD